MFAPNAVFLDDEPHTLSSLSRIFRSLPLALHTFTDPQEALAFLAGTPVAVVVSDFRMPAMNGVTFLRKAADIQPEASRILLTGYADLQTTIDAINQGSIARFLAKPWEETELTNAVLDEAAASTLDRFLGALPLFQTQALGLADPESIRGALDRFLRESVGLSLADTTGSVVTAADEAGVVVSGEGTTLMVALSPSHRILFHTHRSQKRLRDLIEIAGRTCLLAQSARRLQASLLRLSEVDELSGVNNRRAFDSELAREVDRAERYGSALSLLLIDIDNFKHFNDTFGHQTGDEIIKGIGLLMRELTRTTDIAARFGGDEFCLIAPGLDGAQAVALARRVNLAARNIRVATDETVRVTLSVGVAEWKKGLDAAGLLSHADAAVYRVKESGRDGIAEHGGDSIVRQQTE